MNRVASIFFLLISYASSHRVLLHKQRPAATERRMSQGRLPVNGHATEFGNDYYFATVLIGEPAQPAHLIVDTGSSVTYVPCTTTCKHCGHHDSGYFQPQKSSTFASLDCTHDLCTPASGVRCESNQCAYTVRYLEGSGHTGFLVSDNLQLPGNVSQRIVFGCTESEQGQLYTQAADGVMGLGQGPLSIPNQLADENSRDVFALCLAAGGETGVLSLGQQDWPNTVQWTPMLSIHNAWYGLVLNTINIGTMSFTVSSNTVLDSGCTDLLLPNPLFDAISSGIIKHVASKYTSFQHNDGNWCFRGDSGVLRALPDITLALADLPLTLPPSKYVFNAASASQQSTRSTRDWCLAIFPNSNDLVLIGSNAVLDKWVVYDRENHRIGLGDAVGGCASDGTVRAPDNIFTSMSRYPAAAWLAVAIVSFLLGVCTMCIVHIARHRRASRDFLRISVSDGEEVELEEIASIVEVENAVLEEPDSIAV